VRAAFGGGSALCTGASLEKSGEASSAATFTATLALALGSCLTARRYASLVAFQTATWIASGVSSRAMRRLLGPDRSKSQAPRILWELSSW